MDKLEFERRYSISYVPEEYGTPSAKDIFKHYFCSAVIYFLVYIILTYNPYFHDLLANISFNLLYLLIGYVVIAPIILFTFKPRSVYASHNVHICNYLLRILKNLFLNKKFDLESLSADYYEKQSMMLLFIKIFFGTLMLTSILNNITNIYNRWSDCINISTRLFEALFAANFSQISQVIKDSNVFLYGSAILLLYTIDLFFFVIGYFTELAILNNKVKMVETNTLGIFVCLICYPPFNDVTTKFMNWHQNSDVAPFISSNPVIAWFCYIVAMLFLVIYVAASVALFTKASNLTNRGIVSRFPYNIIRHPAYCCKNLCWLFSTLPLLYIDIVAYQHDIVNCLLVSSFIVSSWIGWALVYYFRALTEERFLSKDPDYIEYCKKVKYRFIPYVI